MLRQSFLRSNSNTCFNFGSDICFQISGVREDEFIVGVMVEDRSDLQFSKRFKQIVYGEPAIEVVYVSTYFKNITIYHFDYNYSIL